MRKVKMKSIIAQVIILSLIFTICASPAIAYNGLDNENNLEIGITSTGDIEVEDFQIIEDFEIGLDLDELNISGTFDENAIERTADTIPVPIDLNTVSAVPVYDVGGLEQLDINAFSSGAAETLNPGGISTFSANSPGAAAVRSVTTSAFGLGDYITTPGASRWFAFSVPANTTLFLRMEQPNNASIDYDMYIWKLNSAGTSITLLSSLSEFASDSYTFGLFGAITEDYAVANRTSQTAIFYVEVYSYRGSSSTDPYILYYQGANKIVTNNNAVTANQINVGTGNTYNTTANLSSLIDSNWVAVSNPRLNGFRISLQETNAQPISIAYGLQVLVAAYDSHGKVVFNNVASQNGRFYGNGVCYIRIVPTTTVDPNKNYRVELTLDNSQLVASYNLDFINTFSNFYIGNQVHAMISKSVLVKVTAQDSSGALLPHVPVTIRVVNYAWSSPLSTKDSTYWTDSTQSVVFTNSFGATPAQWPNYDSGYVQIIFGYDTPVFYQGVLIRN